LLSGSKDRAVTLWNVSDQKKIASNAEHRGAVCALAFSPDGRQIASACGADTIKIWNTSGIPDGALTPSMSYHKAEVRTLAFSADGKTLASGSDDNTARLWNVATHQEIASFPMGSPVRMVRFSPDGKTLAIITRQGKLQLFSIP
jgi:WD40 repeat protein